METNEAELFYEALASCYSTAESWATYIYDIGIVQRLSQDFRLLRNRIGREMPQLSLAPLLNYAPMLGRTQEPLDEGWEFIEQ